MSVPGDRIRLEGGTLDIGVWYNRGRWWQRLWWRVRRRPMPEQRVRDFVEKSMRGETVFGEIMLAPVDLVRIADDATSYFPVPFIDGRRVSDVSADAPARGGQVDGDTAR